MTGAGTKRASSNETTSIGLPDISRQAVEFTSYSCGMPTRQRFFAFIRAINVGGRRLSNDELVEPFTRLGLEDVAAYQAAGNITFRTDSLNAVRAERLEPVLAAAYGFDAVTFVRDIDEMHAIVNAEPFAEDELAQTEGRVQVALLREAPDEVMTADVRALVPTDDRIEFVGNQWFWLPKRGVSDSQLPVRSTEEILGPMTIRTLGTLSRMLAKFGG